LLEQLGGPPPADPAPRLDPILFGADPAARGDGWTQRSLRDRAEAAYSEAIRARPLNQSARDALARFHVARGHLERAAATLSKAIQMMPDNLVLRRNLGAALLASGDRVGWQQSTEAVLDHFDGTIIPGTASVAAWACTIAPGAPADPGVPLRLAEVAVKDERFKAVALITLGAALYRAGRYKDALGRLEEAMKARGESAAGWAFLAMAHHRLGQREEARRWLNRLRNHVSSGRADEFWQDLEVRLLQSEAEAVILYDPAFPDDPFSR
jgi:predicted Zn-dependent protease